MSSYSDTLLLGLLRIQALLNEIGIPSHIHSHQSLLHPDCILWLLHHSAIRICNNFHTVLLLRIHHPIQAPD